MMRTDGQSERGFTLVEVLVAISIGAILLTFSAGSLRTYWLTQSLEGAADETTTQLRGMQERVMSESHPLVYGALFHVGTSDWDLVRYDPVAGTCRVDEPREFDAVVISAASFTAPESALGTACSALGSPGDGLVVFYARGSATGGSITLRQEGIDRTETVTVLPITGRVERS